MIIDAHAHVYEYLRPYGPWGEGRAIGKGKVRWPDGIEMQFFPPEYGDTGFGVESLLKVLDEHKVDKAVLMQAQNYGYQNDYVAECVKLYPEKFRGACIFDPYGRKAMDLFKYFVEVQGFRILKFELSETWGLSGIHPDISLDSPLFLPVWEYAEKNDIIIVIDTGERNTRAYNLYPIARVKQAFPALRFVLCHALFPCEDGYNETRLKMISEIIDGKTYIDISSVFSGSPYPYTDTREFLRNLCNIVGADHMMWGSDAPGMMCRGKDFYGSTLRYLYEDDLFTTQELAAIYGETARKLYGF